MNDRLPVLSLETLHWCAGSLASDPGDSSDTLVAAVLVTLGVGLVLVPAAADACLVGRRNA